MPGRNSPTLSLRLRPQALAKRNSGQAATEFALAYIAILVPVTFAMIYTALLLWTWHSISDFTREGARYAVSHCWQNGAGNVLTWMRQNVPLTWDREQFVSGPAEIQVLYYARNPESGELTEFTCDGDCSTACVPDVVKVAVANYEFRGFVAYLGLPPVRMPDFQTSLAVESAGCDAETAACQP